MRAIERARLVLDIESQAILALKDRLGGNFEQAVEVIAACEGKVIVTGIGKSGQIARKIASTMSSTGTPAVFLHPAESSHGDLGMISKSDVVLAISYGGETPELNPLLGYLSRKGNFLIAMTVSRPSIFGIFMSVTTRSIFSFFNISKASSPPSAVKTLNP